MTDIVDELGLLNRMGGLGHRAHEAITRAATEITELREALATVLGDGTHGQNMTWEDRCLMGRKVLARHSAPQPKAPSDAE